MKKKIAVIVRERQAEALRMSIGLTILNDIVDVFIFDKKIQDTEAVRFNLDMIGEMGLRLYTNDIGNPRGEFVSTAEAAVKLLDYDHILPY